MSDNENTQNESVFSKILRAGRRTYFFDVRATRANDYYLTLTESVKTTNPDGSFFYKKFKIFLYKEDFSKFLEFFKETTQFVIDNKGTEVISANHKSDFKHENKTKKSNKSTDPIDESLKTLNFEDL
ncbi:MAG: DUF3276 family protein [Flavobacteriaceae bacterium]|nr:DUF3276 family protein [Flavobacteriaceae bacterium]MDG2314916.1 DUF3276 family protein [Flavobacteriaceae bacterium]